MSFSASVQRFEDWQLRLLVLASLFFQYFLFTAAVVRKLRIPHWFRALIWLAYQGGDVVAIYALATLFNRHKNEELATHPTSAHLETLWAPILLLHLGGQDGITAYSIEDNENWRRHLLVSVSQITIAIYVFRKSWWSNDMRLLRAAILLFVPGILKCLEKPWALKNATVSSIMSSSDPLLERTLDDDDGVQKDISSLEEYVHEAATTVASSESQSPELFEDEVADEPYHLFVDVGHPYSIRLRNLRAMARGQAHGLVRAALSRAFDRLYTKHLASFGGLLRAAVVLLTFVDIALFQRSHRGVYDRADIVVTYVLLCCTAALAFVSACLVLGSGLPPPDDQIAQYNLVGYLARNAKHPWFWALARRFGCQDPLDRLRCTAAPEPSLGITRLVYDHVARGWKEIAGDHVTGGERKTTTDKTAVEAYRRLNDGRGQRTLEREKCSGRALEESLRMPFDESVLLWHLVTEFCYFDHVDTGGDATRHSRMVSNYMAYLLFVEPEMLMPGTRRRLFEAAYAELGRMLKDDKPDDEVVVELELEPTEKKAPPPRAKNEMVRKVIQKVKSTMGGGSEGVVHKAWAVAHELMEFAEKKKEEFIKEQKEIREAWEENWTTLKVAMDSAKEKADQFIAIKNNMTGQLMEGKNLTEVMREADEKTEQLTEAAEEFIKAAREFINEVTKKKQTVEEEKFTDLVKSAMTKAEEFKVGEENTVLTATEFSKMAGEVSKQAEVEKRNLAELVKMNLITDEQELLMIRGKEHADERMWAVIQGVWVEMLCFSAGRCRGYLHAKSLGNGGEYLSYVWLLLSYMGMETMPEKTQRPDLPPEGDTGGLVKIPTEEEVDDEPPRRRTAAPRPQATTGATTPPPVATADARTPPAQQRRPVATPVPAISATAVMPVVGDDIV